MGVFYCLKQLNDNRVTKKFILLQIIAFLS